MFPGGTLQIEYSSTLDLDRDFSQMSAMSVGTRRLDFRRTFFPIEKPKVLGIFIGNATQMGVYEYEYDEYGGGETTCHHRRHRDAKQESDVVDWRQLETTYLNRRRSACRRLLSLRLVQPD
jgi:hypothetical protein